MTCCIVSTTHTITHWSVMWVIVMTCAIGAYWMVVVMPIDMLPIQVVCNAVIWMPPYWPIVPIEWGMPCYPRWTPKPIVNHRAIDIYGLNDIICTIDILIAYHLHCYRLRLRIFLHKDRSHILINILRQYSLNHYQMTFLICCFYHPQIIHITIAIQVKVRKCRIWIIQHLFKLL